MGWLLHVPRINQFVCVVIWYQNRTISDCCKECESTYRYLIEAFILTVNMLLTNRTKYSMRLIFQAYYRLPVSRLSYPLVILSLVLSNSIVCFKTKCLNPWHFKITLLCYMYFTNSEILTQMMECRHSFVLQIRCNA